MVEIRDKSNNDLNQNIHKKVEILAYHKAEVRGLKQTGHEIDDWLQAEEEVLSLLREA